MHKFILSAAIAASLPILSMMPSVNTAPFSGWPGAAGRGVVSAATAQIAQEQSYKLAALTITAPWTRVTPKGAKVAGGYVRITNTGTDPDRLVGGSFDLSARVEVHEMSVEGGVMRMRELAKGLEIAPGASVELKPGGLHLMFMDMSGALEAGKPVKGRLTFEKAGSIDVEFRAVNYAVADLIELCELPIGHKVLDWAVVFPDIDSNGAPTLAFSLGTENVAGTDLSAEVWGTGITAGQTTAIFRNTTSLAAQGDVLLSRKIALKVTAVAATYAGLNRVGQVLLWVQA